MNEALLRESNRRLVEENQRLIAERRELRSSNAGLHALLRKYIKAASKRGVVFPAEWDLPPMQATILSSLVEQGDVSYEQITVAIYGQNRLKHEDRRSITVNLHHLRRKIEHFGTIVTIHGKGLSMSQVDRDRIRAACEVCE